ncbi:unnamed protein product [Linum tenue]|uniref:Uncharacterized protein n=1 Tax=Linum tenue TaxID=586396 RepID=A0AAV0MDZ2_9ROSI|nr:unnamed protein product [Linum tenue]
MKLGTRAEVLIFSSKAKSHHRRRRIESSTAREEDDNSSPLFHLWQGSGASPSRMVPVHSFFFLACDFVLLASYFALPPFNSS